MTGWVFADMYFKYFGESSIVLAGEGQEGKDLRLTITEQWWNANKIMNFVTSTHDVDAATEHVSNCPGQYCQEMNNRLNMIYPYFAEGKLPGSPALAIHCAVVSRRIDDITRLSRGHDDTAAHRH